MPDLIAWQSPLAALGLEARARDDLGEAGIGLAEKPFRSLIDLRGDPAEAAFAGVIGKALNLELPAATGRTAARDGACLFRLGPDQWWLVEERRADTAAQLRSALAQVHAAVTDIGESRARIAVSGPRARDLLAKACPLDLHPRAFQAGHCARSLLAKTHGLLHQTADAPVAYELYVLRSYAEYLWHWLEDAGREYGVAVLRPQPAG